MSALVEALDFSIITGAVQDIAIAAVPAVLLIMGIKKAISFAQSTIQGA